MLIAPLRTIAIERFGPAYWSENEPLNRVIHRASPDAYTVRSPSSFLWYGPFMRTPYTAVPLRREGVLDAALVVAEREGLQRLSMRLLARELNVSTMGLYRHVANKDDLLDGLVDSLLGGVPAPG